MGIFDKLKNKMKGAFAGSETFEFKKLPESLDELKALPEASLDSPFKTAALTILALCAYAADKQIGIEMLNFLRGPRPLSNMEIQFLNDRFMDGKTYVPFSYFVGANPNNDYTPQEPFKLVIKANQYSDDNEGYKKLLVESGGADTARSITLRKTGSGIWYLWEQALLADIRKPKSEDPWA